MEKVLNTNSDDNKNTNDIKTYRSVVIVVQMLVFSQSECLWVYERVRCAFTSVTTLARVTWHIFLNIYILFSQSMKMKTILKLNTPVIC